MIESLNAIAHLWWGWMTAMFWQVSLLIVLIACIDRLTRRWAWPQLRYALWSLVLLKLILPPTLSLPSGIVPELRPVANQVLGWMDSQKPAPIADSTVHPNTRSAIVTPPWTTGSYVEAATPANPQSAIRNPQLATPANPQSTIPNPQLAWSFHAMVIWLTGTLTLGIWLFVRLHSLAGRGANKAAAASLPPSFYNQMAGCAKRLGLRRIPRVVVVRQLATPAVFGFLRPVLLMPKGYLSRLSRKDTEHMLLHELAHIKRGDLHAHGLTMLLQIIYWYNPLLWLVRRQLHHLRELACDATVANLLREQTSAYRQTLLETARRFLARSTEPGLGLLGLFEDSNRLVVRLSWLEKPTWRYRTMKRITVIAIVTLMFVCVLPMAQGQDNAPVVVEEKPSKDTKQDVQLSRELEALKAKLEKLEVERRELQEQLATLALARETATQAKASAIQADKEAAKAKDAAAKALKAQMNMQEQQQWAQEMQAWAEKVQQWEKKMQMSHDLAKIYGDRYATRRPQMPAMPTMPVMPAAPVEVVVPGMPRVAPQTFPPSEPREIVIPRIKPPKVKVPEAVVAPGSTTGTMPPPPAKDDRLIEVSTKGEYLVKSLRPGAMFVVHNRLGSVRIVAGQGPGATVKATVTAKGMTKQEAQAIAEKVEIRIAPTADFVKLDAQLPDDIDEDRRERIHVAFEVAVPPEVNVQIAQKVGSIHLVGLRGDVKATTEVGDIHTKDMKGNILLRTNVGNIDMIVPGDVSAKVDASARVGSVSSDLPLNITGAVTVQAGNIRSTLGGNATGVLGTGEEKIRLDVNVGSIRIQSNEGSRQRTIF